MLSLTIPSYGSLPYGFRLFVFVLFADWVRLRCLDSRADAINLLGNCIIFEYFTEPLLSLA